MPKLTNEALVTSSHVRTHYCDLIMGPTASQITSLTSVYAIVYSGTDQRKHQSSASLAFVRGIHRRPVNSPHKWPVTRKIFPFDDVIMNFCLLNVRTLQSICDIPDFSFNIPVVEHRGTTPTIFLHNRAQDLWSDQLCGRIRSIKYLICIVKYDASKKRIISLGTNLSQLIYHTRFKTPTKLSMNITATKCYDCYTTGYLIKYAHAFAALCLLWLYIKLLLIYEGYI